MNNKKGFTMVELLTVILVLSILALILVPVISGLLESSSKHAFRNSVMGIIDASNNYMNARKGIKYTGEITYPITFTCNGKACTNSEGSELTFKGKAPTSGDIIIEEGTIRADFITYGKYCAYGPKWNLVIENSCEEIDIIKPVITGILDGKVATLTMTDVGSGIDSFCATRNSDASGCNWMVPINPLSEEYEIPSPGKWYFFAKDKKGNISDSIDFTTPANLYHYLATVTTYDASPACSGGRTLSNGNCTYYYSSNSSQCGTENCNCSCNSWYCLDKGKCHAYDPSGNGQCINWDAEWCNVNACGSQSCSTCAKSCTKTENNYRYYACNDGDTAVETTCYHYECPRGGTLIGDTCYP